MSVATGTLRLGTRRSALARAQATAVAAAVESASGRPVELVGITTAGDASPAAVATLGGTGVFVAAVREQLHRRLVDLAVHSYKDLPTAVDPRLVVAAVPAREDPRDVLVSGRGTLADLPPGARVGTGSPRRAALLRAARPDLVPVPLRGNVDTRIGHVLAGRLDAVVLARAGLARLGRLAEVTEVLDPELMLPAPAQGALAVECRADDAAVRDAVGTLDSPAARVAVTAERSVLAAVEAGCTAPLGALARPDGDLLTVHAVVAAPDGTRVLRRSVTGPARTPAAAQDLGQRLAVTLLAAGAAGLLEER